MECMLRHNIQKQTMGKQQSINEILIWKMEYKEWNSIVENKMVGKERGRESQSCLTMP